MAPGDIDFLMPSSFDWLRSYYGQNSAVDARNMNIFQCRITDKTNLIFFLRTQRSAERLYGGPVEGYLD